MELRDADGISAELIELEANVFNQNDVTAAGQPSISSSRPSGRDISKGKPSFSAGWLAGTGRSMGHPSISGVSRASRSVTTLRNPQMTLMMPSAYEEPTRRQYGPLCCGCCRCPACCRCGCCPSWCPHCTGYRAAGCVLLILILILILVSAVYNKVNKA